uniref:Protein phosphatase 1E n=1 Tax=Cacopsylla melanoneura TaxID=428564 RepID=A0A8D8M9H8_9HEMI
MEDYVDVYMKFFNDFNKSVDTTDQLPVKIIVGNLRDHDIIGCVIDWTQQYLSARQCPSSLIAQICKFVVTEMQVYRAVDPENCGYQKDSNVWNPLKLMQATIKKVIGVCQRHKDRNSISKLSPPRDNLCLTVLSTNKNARRTMEDKFTVIDDLHEMLNIEGYGPGSFYGVFDGHGGAEAAMYGASRLFQCLAECPQYPARPDLALVQAFKQTDAQYVEKAKAENLQSGTTAVVAILLQELKQLYIAWIGDTQAIISRAGGKVSQLVSPPHRPNLESEKDRIEQMGGCVLYFNGQCRVQGTLAVSRAIGDKDFKPYVCADPDVLCLDLDGSEDFLLLATDGLWEEVSELEVAREVYTHLSQKKGKKKKKE